MIHCDIPGCESKFAGSFAVANAVMRWQKRGTLTVCPDCAAKKLESPAQENERLRKRVAELERDRDELRADNDRMQAKADGRD